MGTKAQHSRGYLRLPPFLKDLRESAKLTQRDLAQRLTKPQSWVHNCETGNRRVDVAEFVDWAEACGIDPKAAFTAFLQLPHKPPYNRTDLLSMLGRALGKEPKPNRRK